MPKLTFTNNLAEIRDSNCSGYQQLRKYKLVNAIFHVLFLHNGPKILEFKCDVGALQMGSEFDLMINYLSRGNSVKELLLNIDKSSYKLPGSFFSWERLERIGLVNGEFETPLTFKGFKRLKRLEFINVKVSLTMIHRFISNCPLLEIICLLGGIVPGLDFTGGNKITFVDLFRCLPLIKVFVMSNYYFKYLCAGGMPCKLPTPLVHLRGLYLSVRMMEQNEFYFALCLIKSCPVLKKLMFCMINDPKLSAQQTSINILDPKDHSDLTLCCLEMLVIKTYNKTPLVNVIEFMKLVMAKSPVLMEVKILLQNNFSGEEELKMLRDLLLLPFPRASPSAKLIIERFQ